MINMGDSSMGRVRGVRFTDQEETLIDEFLKNNPLIDFSMMVKLAVFDFIINPKLKLNGIKKKGKDKSNVGQSVKHS